MVISINRTCHTTYNEARALVVVLEKPSDAEPWRNIYPSAGTITYRRSRLRQVHPVPSTPVAFVSAFSISSGYQYSSLKEGYGVHASAYVPVKSDGSNHDECDDVGMPQDSTHPECLHNERQGYLSHRRANSMSNGDGHVLAVQSCVTIDSARNETLMISHAQSRSGESSPGIRVSPVASRGEQLKAATHERWVDAKRVQHYFRGCTRKRGSNAAPSGLGKGSYNRTRIVSEAEANSLDTANPTTTTPLDESSIQQSEKDQRMWSALKTSLLSEGLAPLDRLFTGFHNTDSEIKQEIVPGCMEDGGDRSSGDTTTMTFFDDQPGIEGTRNMEQLDLERSAMDRSMRPHRTASARLLATEPDPSSANRVNTYIREKRTIIRLHFLRRQEIAS